MKRFALSALLVLSAVGLAWWWLAPAVHAQASAKVQWIWHNEKTEPFDQPQGTRYFRKVFKIDRPLDRPVDEGTLDITADDEFTVWVNGVQVGQGTTWQRVYSFDVTKILRHGDNVVAVQATNTAAGPAGLLVRLGFIPNGMSKLAIGSDKDWLSSTTAAKGWQNLEFKTTGWKAVRVLGDYGRVGPWKNLAWDSGGASNERFTVPEGFRVEQAVRIPDNDKTFSLVNMCFDNKGRLMVSREGGPILLCTQPDKNGVLQKVVPYCTQVKNCQGMCWVKDALLLVGDGPKGTGLYRVRDTDGDDQTDTVETLHLFKGGMGEHGPHAIIHGPDDWLYLVIGNHAWARTKDVLAKNSPLTRWPNGDFGPDQGRTDTTEDVLLPRLNDSRGHAANILAPGGTIWRLDHQGKNFSLVTAGFRNHFDAAFSPAGELFTFDSDMEWDEALPWYRHVRVCHCTPGADFVWRTGAANTPDYYIDSLPPTAETGRGSPVGVEFYDHHAFPEKYRGAFFMADWAIGVIFAVHLERDGASYKSKVEKFCVGAPMNVTDTQVGPDGALYFVMGGRGTQGGAYRIVHDRAKRKALLGDMLSQPLSPWGRAAAQQLLDFLKKGDDFWANAVKAVLSPEAPVRERLRTLTLLQMQGSEPLTDVLLKLAEDKHPEMRAHGVWLLGVQEKTEKAHATLLKSLTDDDALVRRRACEALVRAGIEPKVEQIWPLLGDKDRFVRHAARLVLERIDPKLWVKNIAGGGVSLQTFNAIVALGHVNQAEAHAETVYDSLNFCSRSLNPGDPLFLDYLRTLEMALIHTTARPESLKTIAARCAGWFPHKDWRANRELAILMVALQREGYLDQPCQSKLIAEIERLKPAAAKDSQPDRMQQIHYAYCLRLLKDGWTTADRQAFFAWYDTTKSWTGGHSFTPFLENIFREALGAYTAGDIKAALAHGEKTPLATLVLAQRLQIDSGLDLLPALDALATRLAKNPGKYRPEELQETVNSAVAKTAQIRPSAETAPQLALGLSSKNPLLRAQSLTILSKLDQAKPKADDARPFRAAIVGAPLMQSPKQKWQTIDLLRRWTGRSFGAEQDQWEKEHKNFSLWFVQTFPNEPPLPNVKFAAVKSKYELKELLAYLDNDPEARKANVKRGRIVFEKASCIKCHKYGKEGEGVGPDLTTLSKRFKRVDVLDSLIYPSKVISDQYRSTTIVTTGGQTITGLAAVQGNMVTVLLNDASKITLKKSDIDMQVASLVSVMPEGGLDILTRLEIADLLAFLESEPK